KTGSPALPWHLGLLNDRHRSNSSTEARDLVAITSHDQTPPTECMYYH
ncbi:hypothetical protein AVEN_169547-1, partial [Araneus ventricosus]